VVMLENLLSSVLDIAKTAKNEASGVEGKGGGKGEGKRAADLYCGVGTFGSFLADYYQNLDLVEENRAALDLARANVKTAAVGETRFFALSVDKWLKKTKRTADYDFVLADPPRGGLSPAARAALCSARTLAYVSCDAPSLARDAAFLTSHGGLRLESLSFYDFYPQTAHIEALAVFKKPL